MTSEGVLYRTLVTLASTDAWLTARQIADAIGVPARGPMSPNRVLYSFPQLFRRQDAYIPLWQLSAELRSPIKDARRFGLVELAEDVVLAAPRQMDLLDRSRDANGLNCRICKRAISHSAAPWAPMCGPCYEQGRKGLEQFKTYKLRLPTMKDFGLYDTD